jgi:hypothetical protein
MFCWWHLAQMIGPHQFLRPFMTFHIFYPKCQQVNLQKTRLIAHMNFLTNPLSTFHLQGDCCKWAYYTHGPYCIWHKLPKLPHESFVYSIQLFASKVVVDWWCQTRCASSCKNFDFNIHHYILTSQKLKTKLCFTIWSNALCPLLVHNCIFITWVWK